MPAPRRQARHDGPPAAGQRQIKFLAGGIFQLPDGSGTAVLGDRVNLTAEQAEKFVRTGAADFVAPPTTVEAVAEAIVPPVQGVAEMRVPGLALCAEGSTDA